MKSPRKRIRPNERVPIELGDRERTLILQETFAPEELTNRLRLARSEGPMPLYRFTLDELDELAGYVAAEANYARDRKLEKELDRIYERIAGALESYADVGDWFLIGCGAGPAALSTVTASWRCELPLPAPFSAQ